MELVVIFVVALLVIGPDKLPQYARKIGSALREFRRASQDVTQELRQSVIDPLEEAQKPLREAMEPLEDLNRSVKSDLRTVEKDLNNLGKAAAKPKAEPAAPEKAEDGSPAPERAADPEENKGGNAT